MKAKVSSAQYSTVSYLFIEDWLYALRLLCTEEKYLSFLKHADLTIEHNLSAVETGDEMIARIEHTLQDRKRYKALSRKASQYVDNRWLEDDKNIDCYVELYQYGVNDERRVNLSRYN